MNMQSHYTYYGGSALGPRPDLVFPERRDSIVARVRAGSGSERRQQARERYSIYTESYGGLIWDRIKKLHLDADTQSELRKFIDLSMNLALDITRQVCVVWKNGARRTVQGASESEQSSFDRLVKESGFDVNATMWNQESFLLGPTTVIPVVRSGPDRARPGRFGFDTLLPHLYEVERNPEDPWGSPIAAAWAVNGSDCEDIVVSTPADANTILLDAEAWHYYRDELGRNAVHSESFSTGQFPGATLRADISHDGSWWGHGRHRRLIDATIMLGVINAALSYTRKAQSRKLLTMIGNLDGFPTGQKLDPEAGVQWDVDSPDMGQINVQDFDTDPENFIKHATWIVNTVSRAYGATSGETSMVNKSNMYGSPEFNHESLTEVRNEQLPFARAFEVELWAKAVAVAREGRWDGAQSLPTPEQIVESLSVEYPDLSRSYSDPAQRAADIDWRLSRGLISHQDIFRQESPLMTDTQATERIKDNIADQMEIIELLTKRNLSMSPEKGDNPNVETVAEMNGRRGGNASQQQEKDDDGKRGDAERGGSPTERFGQ